MSLVVFVAGPTNGRNSAMSALARAGVRPEHYNVKADHGIPVKRGEEWLSYRADDLPDVELQQALKRCKWQLRLHREYRPPVATLPPIARLANRLEALEAQLGALRAGSPIPPIGGGALATTPWVISALEHSADLFRQMPQSLIGGTGVIGSGDLLVTANSPAALNVLDAPGLIWIPGTAGSTTGFGSNGGQQSSVGNTNGGTSTSTGYPTSFTSQGSYFGYQQASTTLSIASADPTNPRIDLICASVQDAEYSGSTNQAILQVVTGTAGSSPAPSIPPANSVILASVWVPASASSISSGDINDLRPHALVGSSGYLAKPQTVPSSDTSVTLTSGTWKCMTGAALGPITVPGSGRVYVCYTGGAVGGNNSATVTITTGVATSSSVQPAFAQQYLMASIPASAASGYQRYDVAALFTGLTPGASETFYPWAISGGGAGSWMAGVSSDLPMIGYAMAA